MQTGAITGYIDVAQIALYVFWLFFAGLVYYLLRENKREGYPLVTERPGHFVEGFPPVPAPKSFLLPDGDTVTVPRVDAPEPALDAEPVAGWPGAPLQPIGNAMLAGVGPSAWAARKDAPEVVQELSENRVVPLRVATDNFLDPESPDPRGMEVVGVDGVVGGIVSDVWIDRSETFVRYLEVTLAAGPSVLLPMPLAKINIATRRVFVKSILGSQFVDVPMLASPHQVTLREEDRIQAYYAGGNLFATASRLEPLL